MMHEVYSGQRGIGSQGMSQGSIGDADRLTNLRRAIDSIEQRLSAQSSQGQFQGTESDIGLMQQQLNRLSNEVGLSAMTGLTTSPGLSNGSQVQANMAATSAQPESSAGIGSEFDAVTADILRRQQALSRPQSSIALEKAIEQQQEAHQQAQLLAQQHAQQLADHQAKQLASKQAKQQKAAMDLIAKHFGDLKKEISALKKDVAKPITVQPKLEANELQRIAEQLSGMQKQPVVDERAFAQLSGELAQLRTGMKDDLRKEMTATHDIQTRLDSLSMGVDALATQTGNAIMPRVDNLFSQIDALRTTIDDLPQTLSITRIDDRLGEMFAKIDAIPVDAPNAIAPDLTSLENRLDEISRALVAVSNMGTRAPKLDLSAIDRLEERVGELAVTVTNMGKESPKAPVETAEMQKLASRIESLTDRLGSFEKITELGDLSAASAVFSAPDISAIEDQLQQLALRLDEASSVNSTAAQISNLEAQIGKILRAMDKKPNAVAAEVNLAPVESRLGQIEDALVSNQQFTVEAAQQAAQNAVAVLGTQKDSGQLISDLSTDLKTLQSVAENGYQKNGKTMADIGKVLTKVVQRLANIETQVSGASPDLSAVQGGQSARPMQESHVASVEQGAQANFTAEQEVQSAVQQTRALSYSIESGASDDEPIETRVVEAPPLDPVDTLGAPVSAAMSSDEIENNRPLEPGTAPNITNLVEEATAQLNADQAILNAGAGGQSAVPEHSKPDPVGAARRALQATKAEIDTIRPNGPTDANAQKIKVGKAPSKLSGVDLRKPIIVAAAAALLLILGTFGYKKFTSGDGAVSKQSATVIEQGMKSPPVKSMATDTQVPVQPKSEITREAAVPTAEVKSAEQSVNNARPVPVMPVENQAKNAPVPGTSETTTATIEESVSKQTGETILEKSVAGDGNSIEVSLAPKDVEAPKKVEPKPTNSFQVPKNAGSAAFVSAASSGEPKALFELGMRYSDGKQVKRDMVASAQWFEKAAETGFAPAQYSIGSLYEKGIGVTKDIKTASSWYEKAAAQGNARAMHNLAVINAMGASGEPDMDTAVRWFKQAAGYGIKDSQFNLGILYGQGMGVPQNLAESYKWFAIAAKTGDTDATSKRDEVAKAMDPANLATAREKVAGWKPQKLIDAVNRVPVPKEWASNATGTNGGLEAVKTAQTRLNERGFAVGTPDGLMGPKTQKAIMEFQRSAGLPITGKVDKRLLSALGIKT